MRETSLKEVIIAYRNLSFSDRIAFYYTVSNDVDVHENNLQDFLIRTRMKKGGSCIYCEGEHIVKNGKRKDGTQRYICRDCGRSFIPATHSIMSGTRKKTGRVDRVPEMHDGQEDPEGYFGSMWYLGDHGIRVAP